MEISIDKLDYVEYSDRNGNFSFLLPGNLRSQEITIRADYQSTSSPEIKGTIIQPLTLLVSDNLSNKVWQMKRINGIVVSPSLPSGSSFTMGIPPIAESLDIRKPGIKLPDEQDKNQTINSPTLWQRVSRFFKRKNKNVSISKYKIMSQKSYHFLFTIGCRQLLTANN